MKITRRTFSLSAMAAALFPWSFRERRLTDAEIDDLAELTAEYMVKGRNVTFVGMYGSHFIDTPTRFVHFRSGRATCEVQFSPAEFENRSQFVRLLQGRIEEAMSVAEKKGADPDLVERDWFYYHLTPQKLT